MEPMTLGSPVGSPAQSPGSPLSNSAYLPSFLLGDPTTPARSSTTSSQDTRRYVTGGGSCLASPVSHYGSPDYQTNRQKAMFGNVASPGGSQIGMESHAGGPPTRSLFDSLETSRTAGLHTHGSNRNVSGTPSRLLTSNANCSSFLDSPTNLSTNETSQGLLQWVTVFGFPPNATNAILSYISSRVRIVNKHPAPHGQANWIHLKCASHQEAQRALACNGNIVSGSVMIGVIPCTDEGVISGADKENHTITNGSMRVFSTPDRTNLGTSDRVDISRTPIRIQNARPLAAGYNRHLSPQSVKSPENVPQKSTGLVSKAMEYVFGW